MEAYTGFAEVYDEFMDNVPYEMWGNYLWKILKENSINDGLVLDLGCGTGKITRFLREKGYDMIGVDLSEEMLGVARQQEADGILYLQQDMREFELYGTVRAVVSVCDSMNYLLEEEELLTVFELVNNYLDPGGIFIFDMNTIYKYSQVIGDTVICENREHASFIWENCFDEESSVNEYALTLFIEEDSGLFRRYEEFHYQRAYDILKVEMLLKQAGLELLAVTDEDGVSPGPESERVYFIAREFEKEQKI